MLWPWPSGPKGGGVGGDFGGGGGGDCTGVSSGGLGNNRTVSHSNVRAGMPLGFWKNPSYSEIKHFVTVGMI